MAVDNQGDGGFGNVVPAWRARRLRAHLVALADAGAASGQAGHPPDAPADLTHRAETRRWLLGWTRAAVRPGPTQPTAKQTAKLARWQAATGRLRADQGERRAAILDAVADELLAERPLKFGAIAAAHRETVRRCREAGLPAPKASRYRRWLKLSRAI